MRVCSEELDKSFMLIIDKYSTKELLDESVFIQDKNEKFCRITVLRGIKELQVILLNSEVEYYKVYLAPDYWVLTGYEEGLNWAALFIPIIITFFIAHHQGYVKSLSHTEFN